MTNIFPVKPDEVVEIQKRDIPDYVIKVINDLIAQKWDGHSAVITQRVIVEKILQAEPFLVRSEIFDNGWLNIETLYREAGWKVEYDKPGYNETYEAYFTFTKR